MHVQVVHFLSSVGSIVNDNAGSIAKSQRFVASNFASSHHETAKNFRVLGSGFGQARQAGAVLGDHQNVCGSCGVDIFKGHDFVVFLDNGSRNVLGYNLVKDRTWFIIPQTSTKYGIPPSFLVPAIQSSLDFIVNLGKGRVLRFQTLEPCVNLGWQSG